MPNILLGYIIKFIFHFYGSDLNHLYQDFSNFHLAQYQVYCKASQVQNYLVKRKIRNLVFYSKGAYNSVLAESLLSNPNTKIYIGAGWIKIFINLNR